MPFRRNARWAAAAAGLVLLLGCTMPARETGSPPSLGVSPLPTPTPTVTPTVVDAGNCDLSVTASEGRSASTHRTVILVFVNEGVQSCALQGYPDVLALDATHTSVPAEHTLSGFLGGLTPGVAVPRVDLTPGGSASAMVESMAIDPDTGDACTPYLSFKVTPPGAATTELPWPSDGCSRLEVHPVVAGTTGRL